MSISRREFVTGSAALSALWAAKLHRLRNAEVLAPATSRTSRTPRTLRTFPFTLGVASGDPWSDSVVIWTRLAPEPLTGGGMTPEPVEVTWQVADDEKMTKVVKRGRATAKAEWAHAVHVEVDGLDADRWYWYQFRTGEHLSRVGRTRTLPKSGAPVGRLKFAFASCQNFEVGYFTAYRHLAADAPDVVFHLGDYLYETAPVKDRPRLHVSPLLMTVEDYRNRYAQYRTDPDLQAAHAAAPWIMSWDDHEVTNNYAGEFSPANDPRDAFMARRAAAYHAYYEHMPLRKSSMPHDAWAKMYRRFQYGSLASFFVLDSRQYRSDQPCNDGTKAPCDGTTDPKATMLGREQERWLVNSLGNSRAGWNVLPQQVMMASVDQFPGPEMRFSMDQWPGYAVEHTRMLEMLATGRARNPVVLTGDIHSNWVNDLKVNFRDEKSPTIATEFVGTSISSGADGTGVLSDRMKTVLSENPFVKYYNGQRGYVTCTLTPQSLRADYRVLDFVTKKDSPVKTAASFVVENGRPGAQKA
jgi:alkaline phosphatase D